MKAKTYFGKVCLKHPELNGKRYRYSCVACQKEWDAAWKRRKRAISKYRYGKVCDKHPESRGLRYIGAGCVRCNAERSEAWRKANLEKTRAFVRKSTKRPEFKVRKRAYEKEYYRMQRLLEGADLEGADLA